MMSEFFHMGGYGGYVWPTYGIAALVLVVLLLATLRGLKKSEKTLDSLQQGRRRQRGAGRESASGTVAASPSQQEARGDS
jgi:heme exporter protein D